MRMGYRLRAGGRGTGARTSAASTAYKRDEECPETDPKDAEVDANLIITTRICRKEQRLDQEAVTSTLVTATGLTRMRPDDNDPVATTAVAGPIMPPNTGPAIPVIPCEAATPIADEAQPRLTPSP